LAIARAVQSDWAPGGSPNESYVVTEGSGFLFSDDGNAEICASLFWELRAKNGGSKIDGLLVQAWFTLDENTLVVAQSKAFGQES
jgi:hypothetical protein